MILADMSASMNEPSSSGGKFARRVDEQDFELKKFLTDKAHFDPLESHGEISLGYFQGDRTSKVKWQQLSDTAAGESFYYIQDIKAPTLLKSPAGQTPLGEATIEGLAKLEARKDELRKRGTTYKFRPVLFIVSDGEPSFSLDTAVATLRKVEQDKKVLCLALATYGADRTALARLATDEGAYSLKGRSMHQVIVFLSRSLQDAAKMGPNATADEYRAEIRRAWNTEMVDGAERDFG